MKAFLLAAGVGSRLRPITDTTPKCMLAISGQPPLDIWLDASQIPRRPLWAPLMRWPSPCVA